jgi:hypothetical protein
MCWLASCSAELHLHGFRVSLNRVSMLWRWEDGVAADGGWLDWTMLLFGIMMSGPARIHLMDFTMPDN